MTSSDDVLDLMRQVASEVITPRFRALAGDEVLQKHPGDFVTIADREAEVALTRGLEGMFPDARVVGEEACFAHPELEFTLAEAEHAFTVDPVDGTRNFVNGSPDHAVMIAEVLRGEQVRGWIWQPEHEVAWVAEKGAGTWRNGERVELAPRERLPLGAISRRSRHGFDGGGALQPVVPTAWCCGVDYPRLLTGELDFLVYKNVHPWDHLPGSVMVREAGGQVGNFAGDEYTPAWTGPGLLAATSSRAWQQVQAVWGDPTA